MKKKTREMNDECLVYEFRDVENDYWDDLYKKESDGYYKKIIDEADSRYTQEYLKIMRLLKKANWYSPINYPFNGLHDCKHCNEEIWSEDIRECSMCEEEACLNCVDLDWAIKCDVYIHTSHKYECDGNKECCDTLCYNDECSIWNPDDYFGLTKSEYDEGQEFIMNLDPDDPADAWFFED